MRSVEAHAQLDMAVFFNDHIVVSDGGAAPVPQAPVVAAVGGVILLPIAAVYTDLRFQPVKVALAGHDIIDARQPRFFRRGLHISEMRIFLVFRRGNDFQPGDHRRGVDGRRIGYDLRAVLSEHRAVRPFAELADLVAQLAVIVKGHPLHVITAADVKRMVFGVEMVGVILVIRAVNMMLLDDRGAVRLAVLLAVVAPVQIEQGEIVDRFAAHIGKIKAVGIAAHAVLFIPFGRVAPIALAVERYVVLHHIVEFVNAVFFTEGVPVPVIFRREHRLLRSGDADHRQAVAGVVFPGCFGKHKVIRGVRL